MTSNPSQMNQNYNECIIITSWKKLRNQIILKSISEQSTQMESEQKTRQEYKKQHILHTNNIKGKDTGSSKHNENTKQEEIQVVKTEHLCERF